MPATQVSVPDAQLEQLDALEGSWAGFRSCLDETAASLEKAKDSFRDKLVHMVESFATDVVVSRDMFTQDAPYSNEVSQCTCITSGSYHSKLPCMATVVLPTLYCTRGKAGLLPLVTHASAIAKLCRPFQLLCGYYSPTLLL